jgi:flavin reductase (DIM6/NTAB) family NADH-FMN oxidoreductase RutF
MRDDFHSYRIDESNSMPHDLMVGAIAPRPIGWISTISPDGVRNLAPYSFFTMLGYQPPLIGFTSIGWKDTVSNIDATGEFVWNLATRSLAEAMNATSAPLSGDVDEFDHAGLSAATCMEVAPARVAASPLAFECRKTVITRLNDLDGRETMSWFVVGQVVAVHIRRDLTGDGAYDFASVQPVLRAGGRGDYCEIGTEAHFHMPRPR